MIIPANFDEIPDKIPQIPPGEYVFNVVSADVEPTTKDPKKDKIVLIAEIIDGPQAGRKCYEHMGISSEFGLVRAKQLFRACGLRSADEFDTVNLIGCQFKALVKNGVYTDSSGETQENSSISRFMYEVEAEV